MVTAEMARESIRPDLVDLVAHFRRQGFPTMGAYGRVSERIGRSPAWIQRVLGRADDASVGLHDYLNIRAAYDRLCARVEAAAEAIEASNTRTRESLHAARKGAATASARGNRLVSPVVAEERE